MSRVWRALDLTLAYSVSLSSVLVLIFLVCSLLHRCLLIFALEFSGSMVAGTG